MASLQEAALAQIRVLAGRARTEAPRRRMVWAAIATPLVLVPVVLNLARTPEFTASLEIFPRTVRPYDAPHDPGYWRSFFTDMDLRREIRLNTGAGIREYRAARLRPTVGGTLLLGVEANDPVKAQRLVNSLGAQLVGASARQLSRQAAGDAEVLRGRIRRERTRRDRRTLMRRLRRIERLHSQPTGRAVLGPRAPRPRLERWGDHVADAMPGRFSARRNPVWAGLAGLLLALTLWAIGLGLVPPAREPRHSREKA